MKALLLVFFLLSGTAQAQVQHTREYLAKLDSNGDGKVSLVEYLHWMIYAFDAMDRDHDGVLAASELPGGKGKPITREAYLAQLTERFHKQDVNHDGFLSEKELSAPPQ